MKKLKWKRWVTLLSLLLTVATISVLAVGYYTASAAVANATITFGANGNWTTYYDSTNPNVSNWSNGTGTAYKKGQGTTTETVNKTKFVLASSNNDPYLYLKFTDGITLKANDIIYVRYCVNQITATETPSIATVFFYDMNRKVVQFKGSDGNTINYSVSLTYREGNTMGDAYAIVTNGGTFGYLRLDIPNDGKTTQASVHIAEIYVGPPENCPVKYTITWKNPNDTVHTTQKYGYNQLLTPPSNPTYGTQKSTIDTESEVNKTPVTYDFKGWRDNTDTALTGGAVHTNLTTLRVRDNKTFYACYNHNLRVRYYSKDKASLLAWEYVRHGSLPTAVPSSVDDCYNSDSSVKYKWNGKWERYRSAVGDTTGPYTSAVVKSDCTIQTAYVDFTATYDNNYRVQFFAYKSKTCDANNPNTNGVFEDAVVDTIYVKHGDTVSSVYSATDFKNPDTRNFMFRSDANGASARYVFNEKWHVGSRTVHTATENAILNGRITTPTNYYAAYGIEYAVRFYKYAGAHTGWGYTGDYGNGWIPAGSYANAHGVPTPESRSKYEETFVAWVSTDKATTSGNGYNGDPTGTAIDPATYKVEGPLFLHPRYLSNSFVGSTTDGLVVKRYIEETDATKRHYRIRLEIYSYGKPVDGKLDIHESVMGSFVPTDATPIVYFQAYKGNGQFDETPYSQFPTESKWESDADGTNVFRTTNNNGYGYLYYQEDVLNPINGKIERKEWIPTRYASNQDHIAYRRLHLSFFDPNFKNLTHTNSTSAINTYRDVMYCREVQNTGTETAPKNFRNGFRIVIVYEIEPHVSNSIGGNNFDISHSNYMKVVNTKADGSVKTYDFHSEQYATTCSYKTTDASGKTVTVTNKDIEPNVNIEIKYDFVVHDYYMDLLDYNNQKSGKTSNQRVIGLLSALQNTKRVNHEAIYGRMFSHGNVNVYQDEAYNPGLKYDMPNTDIDGARNSRVKIYYTVTHENGKLVYATHILGSDTIENSHTEAHVDTSETWADVDFTKDHKVTVNVKVVPLSTLDDSFGRDPHTNTWTGAAEAYFFAPRFIVADYGRAVAVDLQREGQHGTDHGFVETPSYIFRTSHKVGGAETIKLKVNNQNVTPSTTASYNVGTNGWRFQFRYDSTTKDSFVLYGFNDGKTFNQEPGNNHKMLEGYKVVSYTTDVINHLKYSEDTSVTRNVYVIPANNVLYHEHFMDFTKGRTVTNSALNWKAEYTTKKLNTYVVYNTSDTYGFSRHIQTMSDKDNGDYGERVMVATPNSTTRNVYGNFSFTGTGFEILSRTGEDTGVLVAEVYSGSTLVKRFLVDTYLANTTLHQVPIIQCTDLDYGTYTVEFRAYYHEIFDHAMSYKSVGFTLTEQDIRDALGLSADEPLEYTLSPSNYRGGMSTRGTGSYNVYVDGVRIYNPLGTSLSKANTKNGGIYSASAQNMAYALYNLHGERDAQFINLSDMLIDVSTSDEWAKDLTGDGSTSTTPGSSTNGDITGVLYVAADGSLVDSPNDLIGGIYLGTQGKVSVKTANGVEYLVNEKGERLKSKCHSKDIVRTRVKVIHEGKEKYKYVYTCQDTTKHAMNRSQISATGITFYNATYDTIGPEHEIYLKNYNGIAVCLGKNIKTVHVALRSANGSGIAVRAYYKDANGALTRKTLVWDNGSGVIAKPASVHTYYSTRTAMYLDVSNYLYTEADGTKYLLLGSANEGQNGIVGLSNIKVVTTDGKAVTTTVDIKTMMLAQSVFETANELPVDESVQMSHALSLESDISVKYVAKPEQLDQYDSFYMEVSVPVYEGNELVDEKLVRLEPVADGKYYGFYLDGISAKQMNDTLTAKIYMIKDGVTYVSRTDEYSVATYAYNMLINEEATDALKTLCANLLRYGAEAQKYFGYRTDSLADEELAQTHKLYLIDTETLNLVNHRTQFNDIENPTASFTGATLVLNNKVIIRYVLNLANCEANVDELSVRLQYLNDDGEIVTVELTELEAVDASKGSYSVICNTLVAKQMRTLITAAIYHGDVQISNSVQYSIESYASTAKGQLAALCKAMIAYGDAANAFFAY